MAPLIPTEVAWLVDLTQGLHPTVDFDYNPDGRYWTVEYVANLSSGVYQAEYFADGGWELHYRDWDRTGGLSHEDYIEGAHTPEMVAYHIIHILAEEARGYAEWERLGEQIEEAS